MGKKVLAFLLLFCLSLGVTIAQISKVTGVVISEEDDLPIVGASILVKGTTVGALTDLDGKFVLTNIPANSKTIVVSYVGMETQELEIRPDMKIFMKGDTQMLDEVVVTVAYGTAKKSSLTGAISSVNPQIRNYAPI